MKLRNIFCAILTLSAAVIPAMAISPLDVVWINTAPGTYNWNSPTNWSPAIVPGSNGENVYITNPGSYTIVVNSSPSIVQLVLGAPSGVQTLRIDSTTLTLTEPNALLPSKCGPNGVIQLNGGTLQGTATLDIEGTMNWTGGSMAGSGTTVIKLTGTFDNSGSSSRTLSRLLRNEGAMTWSASTTILINGTLANHGTITVNGASSMSCYGDGGANAINNFGTFIKQGAGELNVFQNGSALAFNNSGSVDVQSGPLQLRSGGTHATPFTVAGGGRLELDQSHGFGAAATVSGAGELKVVGGSSTFAGSWNSGLALTMIGGSANFDGVVSFAAGSLSGGTLGGIGTVTFQGMVNWTAGAMNGPGKTAIASGAILDLAGGGSKDLAAARVLENSGTVRLTGSGLLQTFSSSSRIENFGLIDIQSDSGIAWNGSGGPVILQNHSTGTIKKSPGVGTSAIQFAFTNFGTVESLSGALNFTGSSSQQAGSMKLGGGSILCAGTFDLAGGQLNGTGTFTGNIRNNGVVRPGVSPGALTITGNYQQTPSGTLDLEIGGTVPGSGHDQLIISGSATLDGALLVSQFGGFIPSGGQTFEVLLFGSSAGTFATVSGTVGGVLVEPIYSATKLTLAVTANPSISAIANQSTAEDIAIGPLGFVISDSETPAAALTLAKASSNLALVPVANIVFGGADNNRNVTITPAANQFGMATVTITVTDANLQSASQSFQLTVTEVNDPPVATADSLVTNEDSSTGFGVVAFLGNDLAGPANESGQTLNVTAVSSISSQGGTLKLAGGVVFYLPPHNFNGTDSFSYTMTDNGLTGGSAAPLSASATANVTVNPVNDPPRIQFGQNLIVNPGAESGPGSATGLTVESVPDWTTSGNFTVVRYGATGTAPGDFPTSTDPGPLTRGANFFSGGPNNAASGATQVFDISAFASVIDASQVEFVLSGYLGGLKNEFDSASLSIDFQQGSGGVLQTAGLNAVSASDRLGRTGLFYRETSGTVPAGTRTILVRLEMFADSPPQNDGYADDLSLVLKGLVAGVTPVNTPVRVPFEVTDNDTPANAITFAFQSSNPTLVPVANLTVLGAASSREVEVVPASGQSGTARITVQATDQAGDAASDSFLIAVTGANSQPIASDDTAITPEDATLTIGQATLLANDADSDGPSPLAIFAVGSAINGSVSLASGLITFTPNANFNGLASFEYTISDGTLHDSAIVSINVTAVNDPPNISPIANQAVNEDGGPLVLAFNVSDSDSILDELSLSGASSSADLIPSSGITFAGSGANRTVQLLPVQDRSGSALISIFVGDGGSTVTMSFLLTVVPANDPPVLLGPSQVTLLEDAVRVPVVFELFDPEADAAQLRLELGVDDTSLFPPGSVVVVGTSRSRTLELTPAPNRFGTAKIVLTALDPGNLATAKELFVTVNPVNDPPEISPIADQSTEEDRPGPAIPLIVTDLETVASGLRFSAISSNPDLVDGGGMAFEGNPLAPLLKITPRPNAFGVTTITVSVIDAEATVASTRFVLTVVATEDLPDISDIAAQSTVENQATLPIRFSLRDAERVVGTSSDAALVPADGFIFSGTGLERHLTLIPALGRTGSSVIRLIAPQGDLSDSTSFLLTVRPVAPSVVEQPLPVTVRSGQTAELFASAQGSSPISIQWQRNGSPIANAAGSVLRINSATAEDAGEYTAVFVNNAGKATSDPARLTVLVAPGIAQQPQSQSLAVGQRLVLTVVPAGPGPFQFQWRKNGNIIPGANASTFTIENVQIPDSANYSCIVASDSGAASTDDAVVTVIIDDLVLADNFESAPNLTGSTGSGRTQNINATRQAGEPDHAGQPGGKSLWFRWQAPADGVVTFETIGSSFDTLLAVYEGAALGSLRTLASDDDSGGFKTSLVRVNVAAGARLTGAIDGLAGVAGVVVLAYRFEPALPPLPTITRQLQDAIVPLGGRATLSVEASTQIGNLVYRWFFNGQLLDGALANVLTIPVAGPESVGVYYAQVANGFSTVISESATIQINSSDTPAGSQNVSSEDKFAIVASTSLQPAAGLQGARFPSKPAGGLASGYSGTQVFSTYGSSAETGEPNHCGVIGGASQWYSYQAEKDGVLIVTTDGSDFDTVLALYVGEGTSFESLEMVACDNDSGIDRKDSRIQFQAVSGRVYYIAVDGVGGATGNVKLAYELNSPTAPSAPSKLPNGVKVAFGVVPGKPIVVQGSGDLVNWISLLTTNPATGSVEFLDSAATNLTHRYYRAIPLK